MTADEPVEGMRVDPDHEDWQDEDGVWGKPLHGYSCDGIECLTSPSEPVESREQPRGGPPRNTSQNSPTKETITGNVIETTSTRCLGCGCTPPLHFVGCDKAAWPPRQERQLRADLTAALAEVSRLREQVGALTSALERTRHNFVAAVRGTPVRDMTETLAEVDAALAASSETPQDAP